MRVHVEERPRIESTSTSSTARRFPISGCFSSSAQDPPERLPYLENSPPRSAASFVLGFFAARLGARRCHAWRLAIPSCENAEATVRHRGRPLHPCAASSSSCSSEPGNLSMSACGSPISAKRFGIDEEREVGWIARWNFIPVKRSRYARVRHRPHRICGARRPILRILVVVEEHAVALLLPPLRCRQRRHAAFNCSRQSNGRAPDFREGPARLNAHVHVHAT